MDLPIDDALKLARDVASVWRFTAAVTYPMHTCFAVTDGLHLQLTLVTLAAAGGFRSSAGISAHVVRAYILMYELGLIESAEVDSGYVGERITGSACGRMDQIGAPGPGRVAIVTVDVDFDDFKLIRQKTQPVIHILVVDLRQ